MSYLAIAKQAEARLRAEQAAPGAAPVEEPAGPALPPTTPSPAPLDPAAFGPVLARAGVAVGFRVPGVGPELYLVVDEDHADELVREGISRGQCWIPGEIKVLAAIAGLTPRQAQRVACVKLEADGVLAGPDTPGSWPGTIPGLGPQDVHHPLSELDPATGTWVTVPAPYRCACAAPTWTRYGSTPLCFGCAKARR